MNDQNKTGLHYDAGFSMTRATAAYILKNRVFAGSTRSHHGLRSTQKGGPSRTLHFSSQEIAPDFTWTNRSKA